MLPSPPRPSRLARYGTAVTTRQIAEAADVAEGTLFRAFQDKDELIHAALVAALDPAPLVRAIHELPTRDSLEGTLTAVAELVQASQRATARIVQAAHQVMGDRMGPPGRTEREMAHHRHADEGPDSHRDARTAAVQDIVGAIEARISPFAGELRTEPRRGERLLLPGPRTRQPDDAPGRPARRHPDRRCLPARCPRGSGHRSSRGDRSGDAASLTPPVCPRGGRPATHAGAVAQGTEFARRALRRRAS
ncbi:helix-turn-helix domain-containing protein [Oerskovia sp. M15]